ncbi:aldo/keto reductase [Bradyrhizobium sp. AC87j1]|uniref:aldo/keto reductase n=1 Tax=Bradyrhizobium sp. AC87j1 TaxID=2055894 RepID=UPI0026C389CC
MPSTRRTNFLIGGDTTVNRTGFGAMRLSANGFRGPARDPAMGRAVLRRVVELGVNLIDTAAFYYSSDKTVRANSLIREALHPYPSNLVIATKVGPVFGADGSFRPGTGAEMRQLVEENLETLGLDRLDIVYLRIGAMAPPRGESVAERFEALAALRDGRRERDRPGDRLV